MLIRAKLKQRENQVNSPEVRIDGGRERNANGRDESFECLMDDVQSHLAGVSLPNQDLHRRRMEQEKLPGSPARFGWWWSTKKRDLDLPKIGGHCSFVSIALHQWLLGKLGQYLRRKGSPPWFTTLSEGVHEASMNNEKVERGLR